MEDKSKNRSRIVGIRFNHKEYEILKKQCITTTTPIMSEFIRRIVFNKPITVKQRNQSLDDLMTELIFLRTELNHIGNNFNQAVKRLHTLNQITEFRIWITQYDNDRQILKSQIEKIENRIAEISDKWLQ